MRGGYRGVGMRWRNEFGVRWEGACILDRQQCEGSDHLCRGSGVLSDGGRTYRLYLYTNLELCGEKL